MTAPSPARSVTLEESYRRCRELNRRSGTTYYWSTRLLPAAKRPHVHALYGFCRYADDIVDDLGPVPVPERAQSLAAFGDRFFRDLDAGESDDPVLKAVVDTVGIFRIDPECFRRFLRSMTMDLTVTEYPVFEDLLGYMDGSAAVIGEMMLPILGTSTPATTAPARDLGIAFQLTNFCRDVSEDLDRGRVYLPQEDLDRFGARPALEQRRVTPGWEALMRFEIDRIRGYYRSADLGVAMLPPVSARCIAGARELYSGNPRPDRGRRLRRVHRAGAGTGLAQAGRGGPGPAAEGGAGADLTRGQVASRRTADMSRTVRTVSAHRARHLGPPPCGGGTGRGPPRCATRRLPPGRPSRAASRSVGPRGRGRRARRAGRRASDRGRP